MPQSEPRHKSEIIPTEKQTPVEETVRWYFELLFLGDWTRTGRDLSFLKGKRILDEGAGNGVFGAWVEAQNIGAEVISLDFSAHRYERKGELWDATTTRKNVTGDVQHLPLADGSIDLIVACATVPYFYRDWLSPRELDTSESEGYALDWLGAGKPEDVPQALRNMFREQLRVLKSGGEARMWPMYEVDEEFLNKFNTMVVEALEDVAKEYDCTYGILSGSEQFSGRGYSYTLQLIKN